MKINEILTEAKSAHPQQAATAIAMKKAGIKPKNESAELEQEFDLIESIINRLAQHNGVDAEVIWEDLETLTEDELYAFAVTSEPIMEGREKGEYGRVLDALGLYYPRISMEELNVPGYHSVIANKANVPVEYAAQVIDDFVKDDDLNSDDGWGDDEEQGVAEDWQKANKRDKTDGMSQKAVNAYRRENPGSKLKTAVTTKPGKLKKGGKASKRRKSYCSRSRGQMKMHSISCAKTPDKAICKARRRWNC